MTYFMQNGVQQNLAKMNIPTIYTFPSMQNATKYKLHYEIVN